MKNKRYSNGEEWANTLSHGAGILLGIVAGYFLLEKASGNAEPHVYLAGMLSSYVSSTWYHGSRPGKLKELLRKFDHGAIYLHIAGTYTPFTLLVLRHAGGWGWGIFAFVWLSAIAGFILSFKKLKEHSNLETACYVGMGACILVAMKPLLDHLGELGATTAFWWLIGGGVSYLHIAGTYTPFTLLVLRHAGGWGWGIFAFVWLSAIAGFILSFKKLKEHSNLETACYVGMGACILVAMKPLLDHLGELGATTAFWWLIGGGVSYIVGAVFYSLRKPYMHATFHLFCLGGSIGHIIAIWLIL